MSDGSPLNDPELIKLEQRLTGLALPPSGRQRDRLLYSCGQAAGRAQLRRRLRALTAVTALLTCLSAGLGYLLLTHTAPQPAVPDLAQSPAIEEEPADPRTDVFEGDVPNSRVPHNTHLSAATSFEQLLIYDQQQRIEPLNGDAPAELSKRVLTAGSSSWVDELWD